MTAPSPAQLFDRYYFQHGCGSAYERSDEWLQLFGHFADKIVREINPGSVLDAGCALGFLVEHLRDRGVEAFGLDISDYAIQNVRADIRPFCRAASVLEPLTDRYDLIVCIEVLEHLPAGEAERAVANFCQASDDILFSSTPMDYAEATHFNVQPPEYWAGLFAANGFVRDVDFDASFITPWAARFRRTAEPLARILRDYERRFWQLWKENQDLRGLALDMRNRLAEHDRSERELRSEVERLKRHPLARLAGWLSRGRRP